MYVCMYVCVYICSETNWIGHILCRNRLLKPVIEGKVEGKFEVTGVDEGEEDVSTYSMNLRKETMLKIGRGSTRSHCVEEVVDLS